MSALRRLLATIAGALGVLVGMTTAAAADVTYVPSPNNGQKVYLSQSCHDRGSGSCQDNVGCPEHIGENAWSESLARAALRDNTGWGGLLDRQYIVRRGTGLTWQNIKSSNAWGALMHIPLHSNASPWDCTAPYKDSTFGTWGMYVSNNGKQLATQLMKRIGPASPGTNDKIVKRRDLGELNQTRAVAGYLEAEFHTYGAGVEWLEDVEDWDWRLGYAVDKCRGYPREGGKALSKICTW
ncbi:MAG: hypothetical protein R3249_09250 [Nitriliruptorales bacterium]|nr:hypothetical protein [Nitriliruptorales bacterium]